MLMDDFSGGLNTRLAPNLLQSNEAQVYDNIDNEKASITPLKGSTLDTATIDKYFTWYYGNTEFISSATEASFAEYRDILYQTNLASYPTKYDGSDTTRLGIEAPTVKPVPVGPFVITPTDTPALSLPPGTYKYRVMKTVNDGTNDVVEVTEFEHTVAVYSTITLDTALPAGGTTKIYREFDGIYKLAGTTTVADFNDTVYDISGSAAWVDITMYEFNYLYTYYDSVTGNESAPSPLSEGIIIAGGIGTDFNQSIVTVNSLTASADSQVTNIRLYRIGGLITDYTLVDTLPNTTTPYDDDNQDIDIAGNHVLDSVNNTTAPVGLKYLHSSYAMLFGAVGDKVYFSNIAKPAVWPVTNFLDFEANITAIGAIQNGLIVCTTLKTYIVTGNSPETFSKYLLDGEQGCISHYTMKFTNDSLIWLSQDGICTTAGGTVQLLSQTKLGKLNLTDVGNAAVYDRVYYVCHAGGILALDFRYNRIVRPITTVVDWLGNYKDILFAHIGADIHSMFKGDDLTYVYKSPVLTEGEYSNLKTFKDFYIKYNGSIVLKLYIDSELVNTKTLTGDNCYNLKALAKATGYGLEIEITGTAIVSEIEFKALGRQNGR